MARSRSAEWSRARNRATRRLIDMHTEDYVHLLVQEKARIKQDRESARADVGDLDEG